MYTINNILESCASKDYHFQVLNERTSGAALDMTHSISVQSNQKMHDLYATMHIFQMALPDAFWAV